MLTKQEKPPCHAFEVRISIGGNDWPFVIDALKELVAHLEKHGENCGMCSGGYNGSYSVDIQKRDVTPEAYRAELEEWRKSC